MSRKNGKPRTTSNVLPSIDGVITPLTPLAQQSLTTSTSTLGKLSLPVTLNKYYEPYLDNIRDCFAFLERFSEEDETIAKLLELYKDNPNKYNDSIDLDQLAIEAGLSKGEFRRLFNATMDILCDEEALMSLRVNKTRLVQKSIEISLNDKHPDSYLERKSLMEYFGFRIVPKGAQTVINVDKSTNVATSNAQTNIAIANGLPSFAALAQQNEKIVSANLAKSIAESEPRQLNEGGEVIDMVGYKAKEAIEIDAEDYEDGDDEDE